MNRMIHKKRRRLIFGLIGVAVLVLAGFMFRVGLDADLYIQPSEMAKHAVKTGDRFRLGGLVASGSYSKSADGLTHLFQVTDCKTTLNVSFKGMMPSLFREGQGVIAEGVLSADNQFTASRVLAKHDENYEAKGTRPKGDAFRDGTCQHPDSAKTSY